MPSLSSETPRTGEGRGLEGTGCASHPACGRQADPPNLTPASVPHLCPQANAQPQRKDTEAWPAPAQVPHCGFPATSQDVQAHARCSA